MADTHKGGGAKAQTPSVTWAQAVRDIVIASINKGQLPILGMIGIALLVVYRLPEADVSKLALEVIESMRKHELLAYIAEVVTLIAWYVHAGRMRRAFGEEALRIGREKSEIQSLAAGVKFKSSDHSSHRK